MSVVNSFKTWLLIVSSVIYETKRKTKKADIFMQETKKRKQEIQANDGEMKNSEKLKLLI